MAETTFWLIAQDEHYPQLGMTDWHGPFDSLNELSTYARHQSEDWQLVVRVMDNYPEVVWCRDHPDGWGSEVDFELFNGIRTRKPPRLSRLRE